MSDLTAKARRAAEWLKEYGLYEVRLSDDIKWRVFKDGQVQASGLGDDSLIKFAEDRGWQDQELVIPTEEEALALCARGMAQFMDEVDHDPIQLDPDEPSDAAYIELAKHCEAEGMIGIESSEAILANIRLENFPKEADGVEWEFDREVAICGNWFLAVGKDGYQWGWSADHTEDFHTPSKSGTAPTRAEARRRAVEAARGMG